MIEQKIRNISGALSRSSIFLSRSLLESNRIERNLEKRSLVLKRKIVEERGRTLKNLESRDKGTQKGGVLGGALGLLGLGGGGGLLRRGLRRTPKSPSQLLRMQKGTSNLSRVGRFGRFARPLAAVGTGLDFVGRRAEGQSNVQAGVGAAGGLAGSLAGAKAGAFFGSFAGPVGTIVGGAGGAIIGSLAGGRIADLFTGANRRRQFEEERVLLRSQKTLFSEALDDFDKALDKFEDAAPLLVLRRDDDEEVVGARRRRPRPPVPFFQRPAVKKTARVLAASGLIALAAFQFRKGNINAKTYQKILVLVKKKPISFQKLPLEKQLSILKKDISKQKLIERISKSPFLTKRGTVIPGQKGAPAKIKKTTNIIKERVDFKKIIEQIKELNKKAQKSEDAEALFKDFGKLFRQKSDIQGSVKLLRKFIKDQEGLEGTSLQAIKKNTDMVFDVIQGFKEKGLLSPKQMETADKLLRVIEKRLKRMSGGKNTKITPDFTKDETKSLDELLKIIPRLKKSPLSSDLLSQNIEPQDSTNIAQASTGNIFLLGGNKNNNQQTTPPPVINVDGGGTIVMTNPFDAVAANLMFDLTLTA